MLGGRGKTFASRLLRALERIGWFYGLGIVIASAALFVFARFADEVLAGEVHRLNLAVLNDLHAHANPFLDRLALALTRVGGIAGTMVIACLVGLIFLLRRRYFDSVALAADVLGGGFLTFILKLVFRQPRPALFESLAPAHGFSFPSGHTILSFCLNGYLAALLVLDRPRDWRRWLAAALLIALSLGVAWSRLYLGVHWLSDVAAGGPGRSLLGRLLPDGPTTRA